MDEDFMLWNFIEEERDRYANADSGGGGSSGKYVEEDDDDEDEEMTDDELSELLAQKLGQGITRRGGNY